EAYYAGSDYPAAVEAYEAVLNGYPGSGRAAAALLKIAYCYLAQGDVNGGRAYLERVVREYPASAEAALAQARLQAR
ncbi:MAG: tetratricopeptide repeat protein, partial [Gammaproteobacteria bacterium]|nr:tetratricopeptide repeat protein [Gammaproteobacteria bacterium]